jgi:hypothetical protein
MRENTWHDPFGFHFFPVTALVNAPLVSSAVGPTLACYVCRTFHYDTDKVVERDKLCHICQLFVIS